MDAERIRGSLVALRRLFQRRDMVELWEAAFGRRARMDYGDLLLLDAVRVSQAGGATVGAVSALLGIDPSRGSRTVAGAVRKGLLKRRAEQGDARKVVLEITPRGAKLQATGSDLTRARIALAVRKWTAAEREEFAALFARFVEGMLSVNVSVSG
jgi:DNA-binding MarR family transcriptional regulator